MRLIPLLSAVAVAAAVMVQAPAQAVGFGAHWALNEPGTPAQAFDSSGNGNTGTNTAVVGDGQGYVFNGSSSRVTVDDSASLSPGAADFEFGVTLKTTLPAAGTDYDVLRKGLASTAGGEYKIEILNVKGLAKAMCLVKDADKHVASVRWAPKGGLDLTQRHTITCRKSSTGISLQLDSFPVRRKNNANGIGSVGNSGSLFIGIKSDAGGDAFSGEIFDAHVS